MTCRDVKKLLSLYIDKYLPPEKEAELLEHIGTCRACAQELNALKATLDALHSFLGFTPPAPAGLAGRITARIKEVEQHKCRFSTWKRWAAAAAIAVTLSGGSLAYAAWNLVPAKLVAALNLRAGQVETELKGSPNTPGAMPSEMEPEPGQKIGQSEETAGENEKLGLKENKEESLRGQEGRENAPGPTGKDLSINRPGSLEKSTGQKEQTIAQKSVLQPVTFLNKERKINSTYLKVATGNVQEALKAALKAGSQVGATSQVFAVQNTGNNERAAVRFTVSPEAAPGLVESLAKLGTLLDKREESEDVTARFSATLEQYREAVAKANAASDEKERQELIAQAQFLEKQLSIWDKEASEQVIILWLEKR